MENAQVAAPSSMTFEETLSYLAQPGLAAFVYLPVFEEENPEEAAGARVLVLFRDDEGVKLRYAAGPLFMHAFFEDEIMPLADAPEKARALRYIPTHYQEEIFTSNLQNAIQSLMQGARDVAGGVAPKQRKVIPLHPA
jgi:hypothetical protein